MSTMIVGGGRACKFLGCVGMGPLSFVPQNLAFLDTAMDRHIEAEENRRAGNFPDSDDGEITVIAASPDGRTIATCSSVTCKSWKLWDFEHGVEVYSSQGHGDNASCICGRITRVFTRSPAERCPVVGHIANIRSIALSERLVVTGGGDGVFLWHKQTGKPVHRLGSNDLYVHSLQFSPCGTHVAAGCGDSIHMWHAESAQPLWTITDGQCTRTYSIAFSPCGQLLACGQSGRAVNTRDATSGEILRQFVGGHAQSARHVAFHPAGRMVASGLSPRTLKTSSL